MTSRYWGAAAALAAAALAAGCSSSPAPTAHVDHSAFHSNETRFTKPLDDYLVTAGDSYDYATHLITAKCMAGRGYHIVVADPANYQGAALSISVALSVRRAERYGYHVGPNRGGATDTDPGTLPPSEQAVAATCAKRAQSRLGLDLNLENEVNALAFTADDDVAADPTVISAAKRWHSCMLPLGVSDLPGQPVLSAMPTPNQHARFWRTSPEYVPTDPAEVTQAVHDARCRVTSGWDADYYRATVAHQFALMDDHPDLMAKASSQKRRVDMQVADALRSLGG